MEAAAEVDGAREARIREERLGFETEVFDEPPQLRRRADGVRPELQEIAADLLRPDDPSRPLRRFEEHDVFPAGRQGAGPREPGQARPDDRRRHPQNGRIEIARSARARRNVGRSFKPVVRRK